MAATDAASVKAVVIGCGAVGRGMGWYHMKQILAGRVAHMELAGVVEPFFLGEGKATPQGEELQQWLASKGPGVPTHHTLEGLAHPVAANSLAIIAVRTADGPKVFAEVIERGFQNILLEKPGATNVEDLSKMAELAQAKGVRVVMGYNKNLSKYVAQARKMAEGMPGAEVTLVHHNAYKEEELDECFERNREGILKNMMIHELVLLCSFFGMTADTVAEVSVDAARTLRETRRGPQTGAEITDFRHVWLTLVSKTGTKVSVCADRCAGSQSFAEVAAGGKVEGKFVTPDEEDQVAMKALEEEQPGCMPYFYLQDPDYILLKARLAEQIVQGRPGPPEGLASIGNGVEALRLAEFLLKKLETHPVS